MNWPNQSLCSNVELVQVCLDEVCNQPADGAVRLSSNGKLEIDLNTEMDLTKKYFVQIKTLGKNDLYTVPFGL